MATQKRTTPKLLTGHFATSSYAVEYEGAPDNRAQVARQIELEIADKLQQVNATE